MNKSFLLEKAYFFRDRTKVIVLLKGVSYFFERQSKSIKLSKTEYQLMEYFMMNKKQVLSKNMIINTIYNNYWNSVEIAEMLEWIAYSGIFTSQDIDVTRDELVRDMTVGEKSIIGMILDAKGNVIQKSIIGEEIDIKVPNKVLVEMQNDKENRYKVGKYYYSYRILNNDKVLLVIMDSSVSKHEVLKIFGVTALIICGVFILIIVIFFLSSFVTRLAEESLMREKRFISDASHEIKTPLGAISINAQALETEYKDNIYVKNIISESNRMSRLIERLLTLLKLDEGENMIQEDVALSEICEEMALTYESIAFEKGIKFQYEVEPMIHITGNEDEIRQLLAILIDNAIKIQKR